MVAGRPFVVATVVAVRKPTSARPGASGIVHPDGTIEGWVGGSCAQPVVVREALRALADGQPRLLRLSRGRSRRRPPGGWRHRARHDLPLRWHAGDLRGTTSARAAALGRRHHADRRRARRLGSAAGWSVTVIDPVAEPDAFPDGACPRVGRHPWPRPEARRRTSSSPARASGTRRPSGSPSPATPRTSASSRRRHAPPSSASGCARRRPSARTGSPRCARRPAWTSAPRPPRRSPCRSSPSSSRSAAGGPTSWPHQGRPRWPAGLPESITLEPVVDDIVLLDPVCGMTVERAHARHLAEHDGVVYAFCSIGCRTRFIKEPAVFLAAPGTAGMAPPSVSLPD